MSPRKIVFMNTNAPSWTTLVLATHHDPSALSEPPIVVGFGVLTVTKRSRDDWSFALAADVADTLGDEPSVLTRLADVLPQPDFLIADQLEARVFNPLELAADRTGPVIAAYLRLRVARLRLALPVDLGAGRVRRSSPLPYAEPPPVTPPVMIAVDGVAIVNPASARADLECRVIGDWLAFRQVPQTNLRGRVSGTAVVATLTWLTSRSMA